MRSANKGNCVDSEISRRISKATCNISQLTKRAKENKYLTENKCTSTRQVVSVRCSTAVKLGPPTRNAAWTLSICDVSGASSASSGNAISPTVRYCQVLVTPACTPSLVSATWDDSDLFIASMNMNYTDKWQQESRKSNAPLCGSWTLANVTSEKVGEIDSNNWEDAARDRARWRRAVKEGIEKADGKRH